MGQKCVPYSWNKVPYTHPHTLFMGKQTSYMQYPNNTDETWDFVETKWSNPSFRKRNSETRVLFPDHSAYAVRFSGRPSHTSKDGERNTYLKRFAVWISIIHQITTGIQGTRKCVCWPVIPPCHLSVFTTCHIRILSHWQCLRCCTQYSAPNYRCCPFLSVRRSWRNIPARLTCTASFTCCSGTSRIYPKP